MSTIKTSKAFESAGQHETRLWVGNVREKIDMSRNTSLGTTPDTLQKSLSEANNRVKNQIAFDVDLALRQK